MFDGYIRDFAFWTPRAPAVVTPGGSVSYAQLDGEVDRVGAALLALGLGPGSGVVSIRADDAYVHRVLLAALTRIGVITSPAEDDAADVWLLYPAEAADPAEPRRLPLSRAWLRSALAAAVAPLRRRDPDAEAVVRVMLSSGTTQVPKRVAFTWGRLEAATLTNIRVYGPGKKGVWAPLTGSDSLMGFSMTVCAWALGAANAAGVGAPDLPHLMELEPAGVAVVTPALLRVILASLPPGFQPKPGWRLQVGGSALPAGLAEQAALRITPDIWTGYGATESSRITAAPASMLRDVPGAVGIVPTSAVVEIVDEAGRPVADGEAGELRVRSTRTADGYLGDPSGSAERFRDGWYYTHDVARRLADGRIVIEGRLDDRMNLGGRKLLPSILEVPVMAFSGVIDCAAFAVPDEHGLDQAWIAVSVVEGFDRAVFSAYLQDNPHLPPIRIAWIEEIPRNAMGKVERVKLRDAVLTALGR